jgi:glycosyltransferase involved in cell wall biosynthesis
MQDSTTGAADDTPRLLLIGPTPPPLGGTTVAFLRLSDALSNRDDISVEVIETTGVRHGGAAAALGFVRGLREAIARADVVTLHVTTGGLSTLGLLVVLIGRGARKPVLVRKFGGTDFFDWPLPRRALVLWTLRRADLYLAQTKQLVEQARREGLRNAVWFPNSRPMPDLQVDPPGERPCRRFVYLGQVHGRKGIGELIEAGEALDPGTAVDVYGPLGFDVDEAAFAGLSRVQYRGVVDPERVHETLLSYDALVLPSYHPGEGYPGVVLEAFAAGLPVVCTRWRALPELVDESCGILVEPRDARSLREAMKGLVRRPDLYARLRAGVRSRRGRFSDAVWHERFVGHCRELASRAATRAVG